jgi:hypothetical protein
MSDQPQRSQRCGFCLVLPNPPKDHVIKGLVISTEAAHGILVSSVVEKSASLHRLGSDNTEPLSLPVLDLSF